MWQWDRQTMRQTCFVLEDNSQYLFFLKLKKCPSFVLIFREMMTAAAHQWAGKILFLKWRQMSCQRRSSSELKFRRARESRTKIGCHNCCLEWPIGGADNLWSHLAIWLKKCNKNRLHKWPFYTYFWSFYW